jgi:hypothetical protein
MYLSLYQLFQEKRNNNHQVQRRSNLNNTYRSASINQCLSNGTHNIQLMIMFNGICRKYYWLQTKLYWSIVTQCWSNRISRLWMESLACHWNYKYRLVEFLDKFKNGSCDQIVIIIIIIIDTYLNSYNRLIDHDMTHVDQYCSCLYLWSISNECLSSKNLP